MKRKSRTKFSKIPLENIRLTNKWANEHKFDIRNRTQYDKFVRAIHNKGSWLAAIFSREDLLRQVIYIPYEIA